METCSSLNKAGRGVAPPLEHKRKGQLAEALPGAVQKFAASLGVSVPKMYKMMEAGEVTSDKLVELGKILEESAKKGGALDRWLKSSQAQQNNLMTAWTEFRVEMMKNGLDTGLANLFSMIARALKTLTPVAIVAGKALRFMVVPFQGIAMLLEAMPRALAVTTIAFTALAASLAKFGIAKTGLFAGLTLLFLLIEDAYSWTQNRESYFGDLFGAWEEFSLKLGPMFKAFDAWVETLKAAYEWIAKMAVTAGFIKPDQAKAPKGYEVNPKRSSFVEGFGEGWKKADVGILGLGVAIGEGVKASWRGFGEPEYLPTQETLNSATRLRMNAILGASGMGIPANAAGYGSPMIYVDKQYVTANDAESLGAQTAAMTQGAR